MKMKMILMALTLALNTTLLYAADLPTGVINADTLADVIRAPLLNPQGYVGDEFAPITLKQGTKVRVEQTSERYSYQGTNLVQVIPEGLKYAVWTYADKVTLTDLRHRKNVSFS
jgi:hypothetical protein